MLKRVFRFVVRLAFVGLLVYLARIALKRWIDGPDPSPAAPAWSPVAGAPTAVSPMAEEREPEPVSDPAPSEWVTPDQTGSAPSSHPVKVKLASKVYREPGSTGYDRCRPDRCYTSAAAAEADGFVRAKR